MSGLKINTDQCVGCSQCIQPCPVEALEMIGGKAYENGNCIYCGICVNACPVNAITIEKSKKENGDVSHHGIWVFVEYDREGVLPVSYELISEGRRLANTQQETLSVILVGEGANRFINGFNQYGVDQIYAINGDFHIYEKEHGVANAIIEITKKLKPNILLIGATAYGRSLAPRVAASVNTGLTADCTELKINVETGLLEQTRPAFGGNLMATITCPNHRPQMATVRPGVMTIQEVASQKPKVISIPFNWSTDYGITLLSTHYEKDTHSLREADFILVAGKGVGSAKNLKLIKQLADKLGASLGVSRPLVDLGWSEYQYQIGQTGISIAPKRLIAFGISGAIQHLAGISKAETIIAINTDAEAPIFGIADYQVVGDCVEIAKQLIEAIDQKKSLI